MNNARQRSLTGTIEDDGFTLLETLIGVFIMAVALASALLPVTGVIAEERLTYTQARLIDDMRYVQQSAESSCQYGMVRFATYLPRYTTQIGTQAVASRTFLPGVDYLDGYLQLGTSQITYDVRGNAQVAGVIRLVSGSNETRVQLYMGTGLIAPGGVGRMK